MERAFGFTVNKLVTFITKRSETTENLRNKILFILQQQINTLLKCEVKKSTEAVCKISKRCEKVAVLVLFIHYRSHAHPDSGVMTKNILKTDKFLNDETFNCHTANPLSST